MKVVIKNKHGSFEMGGGRHPTARILNISGMGLPIKEANTVTFAGQPGHTTENTRDLSRTITISCDFSGSQSEIERLYKILYRPVELWFTFGSRRRKITGICINPEDVERIIYQHEYSLVMQFVCDNPYFNDFYNTKIEIFQRADQFPNVLDGESWYIQLPAIATVRTVAATIHNKGDTDIYPIIHIYNLAATTASDTGKYGIVVTNNTNNAKITLNYDPQPGEEITVDLPKRKIYSNINGVITNKISDDTVLSDFVLDLGENVLSCTNLSGTGDISVIVEYTNNYAMAVI